MSSLSVEEVKREVEERKRLLAQLGSGRPEGKVNFVRRETSKTKTIPASSDDSLSTLYFHACDGSNYQIESKSVKLMIHQCKNCKFEISGSVLTHCVEIWGSENIEINFSVEIRTLQIDTSDTISVSFAKKEQMGTTVWTGVENLKLRFLDDESQSLSSGFSAVYETDKEIDKEVSQFYVRFVEGELKQEKVLRLKNGFPTTKRESDKYDREQAKAALAKEAYVRSLIKFAERKIDIKDARKSTKVTGRNEPCFCGSGKKTKKCHPDGWIQRPPTDEMTTLKDLELSNAVDPAALLRRAREGDYDPLALPVHDLAIGDTTIRGGGGGGWVYAPSSAPPPSSSSAAGGGEKQQQQEQQQGEHHKKNHHQQHHHHHSSSHNPSEKKIEAFERGKVGDKLRVMIDGRVVGITNIKEGGGWELGGVDPLVVGKIVEARLLEEGEEWKKEEILTENGGKVEGKNWIRVESGGGAGGEEEEGGVLKGIKAPKKVPLFALRGEEDKVKK